MPQFDVTTYTSQLFWLVVCFSMLYTLMARVTMPMIASALETRVAKIRGNIQKATGLEIQAKHLMGEFDKLISSAREKAHASLISSIHKVVSESAEDKREVNASMLTHMRAAEKRIAKRKVQAFDELKSIAEDVVAGAVVKLIDVKVQDRSITSALNKVIEQKVA